MIRHNLGVSSLFASPSQQIICHILDGLEFWSWNFVLHHWNNNAACVCNVTGRAGTAVATSQSNSWSIWQCKNCQEWQLISICVYSAYFFCFYRGMLCVKCITEYAFHMSNQCHHNSQLLFRHIYSNVFFSSCSVQLVALQVTHKKVDVWDIS